MALRPRTNGQRPIYPHQEAIIAALEKKPKLLTLGQIETLAAHKTGNDHYSREHAFNSLDKELQQAVRDTYTELGEKHFRLMDKPAHVTWTFAKGIRQGYINFPLLIQETIRLRSPQVSEKEKLNRLLRALTGSVRKSHEKAEQVYRASLKKAYEAASEMSKTKLALMCIEEAGPKYVAEQLDRVRGIELVESVTPDIGGLVIVTKDIYVTVPEGNYNNNGHAPGTRFYFGKFEITVSHGAKITLINLEAVRKKGKAAGQCVGGYEELLLRAMASFDWHTMVLVMLEWLHDLSIHHSQWDTLAPEKPKTTYRSQPSYVLSGDEVRNWDDDDDNDD